MYTMTSLHHLPIDQFLKLFTGLISVINPIGAIPIFIGLTESKDGSERKRIARVCALSVGVVLLLSLFCGEWLLRVFGIGIPAFRVAGGILVLLMGISMLRASKDRSRHTPEESIESATKESIAIVPLAIPLLSGPGSISTTIVYAHQGTGAAHYLMVSCVVLTVTLTVLAALSAAPKISDILGKTGMNVITRVMGLILASIAIEFIAKGLLALFPVLGATIAST